MNYATKNVMRDVQVLTTNKGESVIAGLSNSCGNFHKMGLAKNGQIRAIMRTTKSI
jgi:hypothetical protein